MSVIEQDMLSALLNDPQKLKSAIEMATSALGSQTTTKNTPQDNGASSEVIQKLLPVLSSILASGEQAVSNEKRSLLHAVKPFVSDAARADFDHALRLASTARMLQRALQSGSGLLAGPGMPRSDAQS